ncbi:MAG: hypothetical protein QOK13_2332 [Gaiellaceae bacterium]|jgi:hypothetical protein|nr:hypothetical protein [Gaiellaceae bacterium]MDX6489717.1 hypothetical protein [Gaiellaceae bacterium]
MKRIALIISLLVAALSFAAVGAADDGHGKKDKVSANGGRISFDVVTQDHGCDFRVWANDKVHRTFTVKKNGNGSYTVRRTDKGVFTTVGGQSPSADPCPGVIRKGKHGQLVTPGITGKMHGYIAGTVTGGTFNPNGTCAAPCGNAAFLAGFFTAGSQFTCVNGYAGCRFSFEYTAQKSKKQSLLYHHWVDRGTDGVHEIFIGDIATS